MPRRKRSEESEARRFGVILAVILVALATLSYFRGHPIRAGVLAGGCVAAGVLPFAAPGLWLRMFRGWMKLALAMSWVMTRVLLSIFFYLILTPTGLVLRLLGRAPLDLAWKDGKDSYWIDKTEGELSQERYSKQY